jgi:hypothetical protein
MIAVNTGKFFPVLLNVYFRPPSIPADSWYCQFGSCMAALRYTLGKYAEVTGSNHPEAALNHPMSVWQRLPSMSAAERTHADCQEAAVGFSDPRWPEWRL